MELNSLLVNMNYMIRRVVGKGVALQAAFGASVPPILADAFLVEQTVLNLILNARDAMPNGDAITLQTSTIMRRNPAVGNDGGAATGEFVRLTIRDTGCGMTPEVQAHLFEPFFSTKDVGRGTGLGLASVYGAVKQQAGWIEFSSEPGKGTEARVFFPCAPAFAKVDRSDSQFVSSLGTVLLVEADDRTRGMARCILNWNGYRVIEADSSTTALILWSQQAASVDLLLVDATLADGMSGRELASRLVQTKPTLKIVYAASSEAVRTDGPSVPDDHSKRLANP